MPAKMTSNALLVLITLTLTACGIYDRYGYGRIAASQLDSVSMTPLELPQNAPSISQRFRPTGVSAQSEHKGFDILVAAQTPVLAAADGEVSRVQTSILYGRQVMIDHGMVAADFAIQTRYFHLSAQQVAVGDQVQRGQVIGYSGASGMAGVYPHLHFEVHRLAAGSSPATIHFLDPQLFWVDGVGKITCYDSDREWKPAPVALTYPVPCLDLELGWEAE